MVFSSHFTIYIENEQGSFQVHHSYATDMTELQNTNFRSSKIGSGLMTEPDQLKNETTR